VKFLGGRPLAVERAKSDQNRVGARSLRHCRKPLAAMAMYAVECFSSKRMDLSVLSFAELSEA